MSKHNYAYSCKTLESSNPYNIENALAFPYGPARGRPGRGSSPHRRHGAPRSLLNASWWARRAVSRALCSWMHGGPTMASPRSAWRAVERSATIEMRRMTPTFARESPLASKRFLGQRNVFSSRGTVLIHPTSNILTPTAVVAVIWSILSALLQTVCTSFLQLNTRGDPPGVTASPVDALILHVLPSNDPYEACPRSLRKSLPKPRSLWMPARNSSMSCLGTQSHFLY